MYKIIPEVDGPFTCPWPGVDGKSRWHEFGRKGIGSPVTVLAGDEDAYVSWRDGKHYSVDEAERMIDNLQAAVNLIRSGSA